MATLTNAGRKALERAAKREGGNICPVLEARGHAETVLIAALVRLGYVEFDYSTAKGVPLSMRPSWVTPDSDGHYRWGAPRITDAGRAAIREGK